ncbi:MAG: SDR family oxidoreductase [Deinococcota bacterium]|nr:SDR family oxidoreductase [Deinococcota bacterium]
MDFSSKRVLVTGGARGIGRAVAQAFAARGAQVALSYRSNHEAAQETLATLLDGPHVAIPGDIADPEVAAGVVKRACRDLGGLDIVVNNAGVGEHHPLEAVSYGDWQAAWQRILAVNLLAPANICYCAAHYMIERGGGRIVNVSSRGAFRGEPEQPAYGASKAGLNAMSQSLAQKLAPHGIFVGVVAPGFVETDMAAARLAGPEGEAIRQQSPLGRVARPEEVAHAVLFLASPGAEFSTGTIIDVNGASYLRS